MELDQVSSRDLHVESDNNWLYMDGLGPGFVASVSVQRWSLNQNQKNFIESRSEIALLQLLNTQSGNKKVNK